MNTYALKQEAKRERFAELAERKRSEAAARFKRSDDIAQMIPFGQPILVGHHSEAGHRRALDRIHTDMRKGIELDKTADYYEEKAENYGTHGISSDNPEAVELLGAKLDKLRTYHDRMIAENKVTRANGSDRPFAGYQLTNNSANMRTIQKRIEEIQKRVEIVPREATGNGWTMQEDLGENRIMFLFDSIPSAEVRAILKGRGFKWSPTRSAWVRMLNGNGRFAARYVIESLTTSL